MTKFAKYLQRHCVHEWSHKYVKYKQLKKLIKQQQQQQQYHAPEAVVAYTSAAASEETRSRVAASGDTPLPSPRPSYSGLLSQLDDDPLADMPLLTLPAAPLGSAEEHEQHEGEEVMEMTDLRQSVATSTSAVRSRRHLSPRHDVAAAGGHFDVHALPFPMSDFLAATGREVSDIERFYGEKETELLARVAELVQLPLGVVTASQQQRVAWQCRAVYRALLLLHKYRSLNYVALCKIVKKHDKLAPHSPLTPHVLPWLDRLHCFASPVPQRCMQQLVALYAAAVLRTPHDGDRAKKELEPPTEQSASRGLRLLLGGLVAACVMGVLLAVVQGVVVHFSAVELPPGALAALSVYRLLGILLVHSMLWLVCLRALKRARVNCALILGMDVDSATPLSHLAVFLAALALLYLVSLNLYLLLWQLIASSVLGSSALAAVFAVHCTTFALIVALCCNPLFPTLRSARRYFASVLWQVVTLPFSSVTFQATFLANQATSLMQCLPDLTFSLCFYLHSAAASSYAEPAATAQRCSAVNFTYIAWWLASLPNTWRCVQCVKKYRAGAGNRSLGNAVSAHTSRPTHTCSSAADCMLSHTLHAAGCCVRRSSTAIV